MKNLFKIFSILLFCACVSGGSAVANTPGEVTDSWNTNKAYTQVQDNLEDSLSALIIFDRSYTSYRKYIKDNKLRFEISTTVHRRIKILSTSALENFNKVYVPSVGDMFIKNEIVEIKGRTIKPDGTVIDLDSSDVRETTLPANVPFYSNYNGKVKLFALPGINVGDEVEYFYTFKNDIAERKSNFQKFGMLDFERPYPCLEKSYVLSFNKEFSLKSYSVNTGINLEKQAKEDNDELVSFKVTTKNLPASVSEAYSLDYKTAMSIYFHIYESTSNEIDGDWKDVSKIVLTKANKYTVVGNKLWMTFNNEIRKQKSFQKKVEKAAELINEPYLEKKEYLEGLRYRTVSRYDLSLINNIANAMDATVNLWYVADKTMAELKENIPSTLQFNDVIVEFVKGNESYYAPFYRPLDAVDEVDYDYHNTRALKLSIDKRNRVSYELTTFKLKPGKKENKIERNLDIHISLNYETKVSVSESNKYYGEATRKHKYPVYIQYSYTEDNGWKYLNTNRIKRRFNNVEVTEASAHRYDPKSNNPLSTSLKYNYSLSTYKLNTYSTNLADLLGVTTDFYLHCEKRKSDAYLGYPYSVDNTYKIKIDKGSAFVLNEQFNQTLENAVGSIKTSIEKISDEEIKITLQYAIKQDYVGAVNWCQYTELDNAYERFLKQLIIVTR